MPGNLAGQGWSRTEIRGQLSKRLSPLSGRTRSPPSLLRTYSCPRSPQRLRASGRRLLARRLRIFLENVYACNPQTPAIPPKIHVLFKRRKEQVRKVGRRSAQHPRGKDACLALCPAVRPALRDRPFPGAFSRGDALDRSGRPGFEWLVRSSLRGRVGCREFA